MREGSRVKIKPEAWVKYQLAHGIAEPCPEEVTVVHVAGELTSLKGYVWLGMGLYWWRTEDLISV